MAQLFNLIWDICRLRKGPQDLPYSPAALVALCAITLVFETIVDTEAAAVAVGVVALGIYLSIIFLLLNLRGLRSRFVQTAIALLGCALVFNVIMLPLVLLFGDPQAAQTFSPGKGMLILALLLIMSWKLIVDANIFRHGLNVPFFSGLMIAVMWFIIAMYAVHQLMGSPPPAA